jgi:biotin carboxyl carrier protein
VDTLTKYTVAIEDKQYKIDIMRKGAEERFIVKVEDKPHEVELIKGKFEYEKPLQIKIGEKTHSVQINKTGKQAPYQVKIGDVSFKAEVKTQHPLQPLVTPQTTAALSYPTLAATSPANKVIIEGAVTAPMAGKIVSVKIRKGDTVKAGAVLCILEAMKMENEITSNKDGVVKEILISEGAGVNKGEAMFVIE